MILLSFFIILSSISLIAQQQDPVAITINGEPIYKSEVEQAFQKSNAKLQKKESIGEFLPYYIDFKLNIKEAREQHLDKEESFTREIVNFKMMQSDSYLRDTLAEYNFLKNIYDRLQEEREINHVMIPFGKEEIFPSDTLALYKKALELRKELINNNFTGEGYSSKQNISTSIQFGNEPRNGYVGWVMPFMFPYPVENVIYNLNVKEISMPIRSVKGYHLVQLLDKRPSRGQLRVQQVHYSFPVVPPNRHQIDSVRVIAERVYSRIHSAEDYDELCARYAETYNTGEKGCDYGLISLESKMPPSFINAVYNLQDVGDISKPVMTDYGFHIIRLTEIVPSPSFKIMELQLFDRVRFGDRLSYFNEKGCEQLMKKMSFSVNNKAYKKLQALTEYTDPQSTDFIQKIKNEDDILFTIDGRKTYKVKDFILYLQDIMNRKVDKSEVDPLLIYDKNEIKTLSSDILDELFFIYSVNEVKRYAKENIEKILPGFDKIIKEYTEGLLLFNIKNKNIWERSAMDEKGLEQYFNDHNSRYTWDAPKYKGLIIHCKDEETLSKAKSLSSGKSDLDGLSSVLRKTLNSGIATIQIEKGLWAKGENKYIDHEVFSGPAVEKKKAFPLFFVTGKLISSPQNFRDDRARVEADYQLQLEARWNEYLRKKYKVEINDNVINSIR